MDIKSKIHSVLGEAYSELKLLQNDFFIIGSAALILSGVGISNTNDIDILVSDKDAGNLKMVWKDRIDRNYITQRDDLFRSDFSRYRFGMLDIEAMGNLEVNKNGTWTPLKVYEFVTYPLNDIQIKMPTIKEQKRILNFFGREKDKEKIKLIEGHEQYNCLKR